MALSLIWGESNADNLACLPLQIWNHFVAAMYKIVMPEDPLPLYHRYDMI